MKRKRYSGEQIVYALRQVEAGSVVVEICRKLGVSEQTFYRWKKKYSEWGYRNCESCDSCERRTESSSCWWRISSWTSISCRRCSQKRSKACP